MMILILILSFCFSASYKIDIDNSSIQWIGRKVTGEHDGMCKFYMVTFEATKILICQM